MPSKSQLTGQSDIWDLSDYFPPGEPWETSFKWYKPAQDYTSQPYAYIETESYSMEASMNFFELREIQKNYSQLDQYSFSVQMNIELRETLHTYNIIDKYTFSQTIQNIELRNVLKTYGPTEYYEFNPNIQMIEFNQLIRTTAVDEYIFSPSIQGVTLV